MTVSSVGTPAVASAAFTTTTQTVTATWGTGQTRTAGNLLVGVVTVYGTTTGVLGAAPSGWTLIQSVTGSSRDVTAYYTKVAAGTDTAPVFNGTETGTAADATIACVMFVLSDSGGGTPVAATDGTATGTTGTLSPATTMNVPSGGCFALAGIVCGHGTTAATITWTTPSGWTACTTNQTASARSQMAVFWDSSAPSSGSTLSVALAHGTSTTESALILVVSPPVTPAWALAQSLKSTPSTTATIAATFGSSVTSGNRVFVFTGSNFGSGDVSSVTDSQGNLYTKLISNSIVADNIYGDIWTAVATSTGTLTITVAGATPSPSEYGWTAAEYSGLDASAGSGCLDVSVAATPPGEGIENVSAGTTSAVAGAGELALCLIADWASATWTVAGAGFVKNTAASIDGNSFQDVGVASMNTSSGGVTCSWTPSADANGAACIAVIKLATTSNTSTGSVALPKAGIAGTVTEATTSTGSAAVRRYGISAAAVEKSTSTGSTATRRYSLAVTVTETTKATGSLALPRTATSGTGSSSSCSGGLALRAGALTGAATEASTSTGSAALHAGGLSGAASSSSCAGSIALPRTVMSGTATEKSTSAGSLALPAAGLSGDASEESTAAGSAALPVTTLAGTATATTPGGSGSIALPAGTLAGSATEESTSSGSAALPAVSLLGTATETPAGSIEGLMAVPATAMSGSATEESTAAGSLALPAAGLSGAAAEESTSAGSTALSAAGLAGVASMENTSAGSVALPHSALAVTVTETSTAAGSVAVAVPGLAGTATETSTAAGSLTLPHSTLAATAAVIAPVTAAGSLALPAITVSGSEIQTPGAVTVTHAQPSAVQLSNTAAEVTVTSVLLRQVQVSNTAAKVTVTSALVEHVLVGSAL